MTKSYRSERIRKSIFVPTARSPRPRLEFASLQRRSALQAKYQALLVVSPEETLRAYALDVLRQLRKLEIAEVKS